MITKRLVELMGGAIGVSSQPGQGSTFWVEIALSDSETISTTATPASNTREATSTSGQTILYIEDNPANLRLVTQIINAKTCHRLISAPDAALGLALADTQQPALILLDINLPGMDGYRAFRHLQANAATRHIPVIAVSANAMPNDVKRGKAAGFMEYLTKPIDVHRLLQAIKTILDED